MDVLLTRGVLGGRQLAVHLLVLAAQHIASNHGKTHMIDRLAHVHHVHHVGLE
jgi:hypothetical protein